MSRCRGTPHGGGGAIASSEGKLRELGIPKRHSLTTSGGPDEYTEKSEEPAEPLMCAEDGSI